MQNIFLKLYCKFCLKCTVFAPSERSICIMGEVDMVSILTFSFTVFPLYSIHISSDFKLHTCIESLL